jgi:hypothetical protein
MTVKVIVYLVYKVDKAQSDKAVKAKWLDIFDKLSTTRQVALLMLYL